MGYYTGNGVITGGSTDIAVLDVVNVQNTLSREQLTVRMTKVKNGVSLATAQAATPSCATKSNDLTAGGWAWPTPNCSGRITKYSYIQISGSNLYQLVEESETYQKRLLYRNTDNGTMTPGNWAALP